VVLRDVANLGQLALVVDGGGDSALADGITHDRGLRRVPQLVGPDVCSWRSEEEADETKLVSCCET
jgi:hypothetical protein